MDAELVRSLTDARRDRTVAVLEGVHALKHALRFGATVTTALTPDRDAAVALLRDLAPDVVDAATALLVEVDAETWEALAPRGLPSPALSLATRPQLDPATVLRDRPDRPVVLLEDPTHLGNVGAVVRVAAAADAAAVLTTGRSDPWHPSALRGGAGLQLAVPTLQVDALPPTDRPVVVLDPGGVPLAPGVVPAGAVLAFGTERGGLSPALRDRAELAVGIPMRGGVSSLNLATSVAVTLYASGLAVASE